MTAGRGLILGTAGHIDHGKTALVRALTGVDCDRLPEERRRGITIELGFAHLDLPSGRRLGVIDVPGHEKLVRTMVSGATGMDLVLFVVAADEGLMPQSREHLAICRLLGIERGAVALTKCDAVDAELLEVTRLEVCEELAATPLAGAPLCRVSALRGDGIAELVATLDRVAQAAPGPGSADGPSWLPVDRAFTLRGFGTVATGTLRGDSLADGAELELLAPGARAPRSVRIRGLQVHGEPVERALPGSRCALNLQGVDVASVPRGSVLAAPGRLAARARADVELELLPGAAPLRSGSALTVHAGTSERLARVSLLGRTRLAPGERALAELRFAEPLVAVAGERFIARGFARLPGAGWTVGGGRILDVAPPAGRRQREQRRADLERLARGEPGAALAARLRRAGLRGARASELLRDLPSLAGLAGIEVAPGHWLDPELFRALVADVVRAVETHHRERPSEPWAHAARVASLLGRRAAEDAVRAALAAACADGALAAEGGGYRLAAHRAHLPDAALAARVLAALERSGLAAEPADSLAHALGAAAGALGPVLEYLAREGRLTRIAAGHYVERGAVDALRLRVAAHLREHGSIDPTAYKQLTGQSRKYTVPLMEFFDAERLTARRGNLRVLRGTR